MRSFRSRRCVTGGRRSDGHCAMSSSGRATARLGLWLPETAVDRATLRVCAEEGVRWTILAPWQAGPGTDTGRPHRVELGDGLRMLVASYDAGLSTAVSFDPAATADADRFAREVVGARLGHMDGSDGGSMAIVCTDGELYGHHQPFRDLFLERLLTVAATHASVATATPGEWLATLDPMELPIGSIVGRTSWSCHHGVARWASECGCAADGRWKAPLRQAFDRIAGAIDTATEAGLAALGIDPWAARDRYVVVASGFEDQDRWVADELARAGQPASADAARTLGAIMAAQASGSPCSRAVAGTGIRPPDPRPAWCCGSRPMRSGTWMRPAARTSRDASSRTW